MRTQDMTIVTHLPTLHPTKAPAQYLKRMAMTRRVVSLYGHVLVLVFFNSKE